MVFSSQLIDAARSILAESFVDRQELGADEIVLFQHSIETRVPEAANLTLSDCQDLIDVARDISGTTSEERTYNWDLKQDDSLNEHNQIVEENYHEYGDVDIPQDQLDSSEYDEDEYGEEEEVEEETEEERIEREKRMTRHIALGAVNHVLNVYYPDKTLSANTDFDQFRELFTEEVPEVADQFSDEALKMLLFTAGGTLIGALRPREERLAKLQQRNASQAQRLSRPSSRRNDGFSKSSFYDTLGSSNGSVPRNSDSLDLNTGESISRNYSGADRRFSRYAPSNEVERERNDSSLSDRYDVRGYDDPRMRDDRSAFGRPSYYDPKFDERGVRGIDPRYMDRQRYGTRGYDDRSYSDSRSIDRESYDDRVRPRTYDDCYRNEIRESQSARFGNGYYSEPDYRGGRRAIDERSDNGFSNNTSFSNEASRRSYPSEYSDIVRGDRYYEERAPRELRSTRGTASSSLGSSRAQGYSSLREFRASRDNQRRDLVELSREIFNEYFEGQVPAPASFEFRCFRKFVELKHPEFVNGSISLDEELQKTLRYFPSYSTSDANSARLSAFLPHEERAFIKTSERILKQYFLSEVLDSEDFEHFQKIFLENFQQASSQMIAEDLKRFLNTVGAVLKDSPTEEDERDVEDFVYTKIASRVLEKVLPRAIFKSDLSDFGRFRQQFKMVGGPGADLDENTLCRFFIKANGRFVAQDSVAEPSVKPSLGGLVKKLIFENFPNGIELESEVDLMKLRSLVRNSSGDQEEVSNSKLLAQIERSCILHQGRAFSIPDKTKNRLKEIIEQLFNVGAQIVYYESCFEKNSQWLRQSCIGDSSILQTILAHYFSDFLFYSDFFEREEDDESERVKIEREIARVWGPVEQMTAKTLGERLYVPTERLQFVLEHNKVLFKQKGEGYSRCVDFLNTTVDEKESERLDDLFDATFYGADEVVEEASDTTQEMFARLMEIVSAELSGGASVIYFDAFLQRNLKILANGGTTSAKEVKAVFERLYPDFVYYDRYCEVTKSDLSETEKIKKEIDRVWDGSTAKRIVDISKRLYVSKDLLTKIIETEPEFTIRSNGYWGKTQKTPSERSSLLTKQSKRVNNNRNGRTTSTVDKSK